MFETIQRLKDIGNYIKALQEYISAKDKVLWESDTNWQSGSQTIPGILNYKTLRVYPWITNEGITLERAGDKFFGEGMISRVSGETIHTSVGIRLTVAEGDIVTFGYNLYVHHHGNDSYHSNGTAFLRKIVGQDPVIPDALKALGGGITLTGGAVYA